ncbi:hypothetical protein STAS_15256 [Striga asiatica]|uniref:Filament-like plant protein n=1 Tax=Striga asiatica TaxID=4170 RepID=A0A5A7Q1Q2_STRAF|nr:hypothetical protein STAS_15256 [Striga asiatica]
MEKRKWPWKKKLSERSPGESESSGSFSSHSERYSDEQEVLREEQPSNDNNPHSPEVTSKAPSMDDEEVNETVKSLTQKLSAALVNISTKEDLVKQHAKVAEEAIAGWEKAENEVTSLKQQLETALQQNTNLEARANHLDGALKECVRQLRQSKDKQEKRISNAIHEKSTEWESQKAELERQIFDLQNKSSSQDPETLLILDSLERENTSLRQELDSYLKELEIVTIERDLSTQAAESASKSQLESIKKIARLEAECRKIQSNIARKLNPLNNHNHKYFFYAESLTDSCKSSSTSEHNCLDFDLLKNEKHSPKNLAVEIDIMDDFLEMERLASLPGPEQKDGPFSNSDSISLRDELESMSKRVEELENELKRVEMEKFELQNALEESLDSLKGAESKLKEVEKELKAVNETKELLEFQLVGMEVEARTHSESIKAEIEREKKLSGELSAKCQELESIKSNAEPNAKQEEIAVAADKLAECQKTIASLGRQLESLATLEDFLIETSNISNGGNA